MWHTDQQGAWEFAGGKEDWQGAARVAARCPSFRADVEEEQIADEARSCYNCRYRRWSTVSFTCCAPVGNCTTAHLPGNAFPDRPLPCERLTTTTC